MKHLSNSKQNVPCIQPRLNENEMKVKMKKSSIVKQGRDKKVMTNHQFSL